MKGRFNMKLTKIAAVALAGMMLLAGCGNNAGKGSEVVKGNVPEGSVMTVGDVNISEGLFKAGYKSVKGSSENKNEDAETSKKNAVDQCVKRYEVVAIAHAKNIKLDDALQKELDEYKQQMKDYYAGQEGGFEGFLKENGVTEADLDLDLSVAYYADMLMDSEMKAYFKNNYRRAKHVLIKSEGRTDEEAKAKAEDILKRAQGGENFDQLIKDNGEDPGMEQNPDGYYFTDGTMVQEFQDGVDSIKPGEFTLVKTSYGYHVIQRLEMNENDESYKTGYENAKYEISSKIGNDRFNEVIEQFANECNIKIVQNDEAINKASEASEAEYAAEMAKAQASAQPAAEGAATADAPAATPAA